MNIELRKISFNARLSEETNAFVADIYLDGKKVGDARNSGHGGSTLISPRSLEIQLDEYAKTLPMIVTDLPGLNQGEEFYSYAQTGESIIDGLLNDHLVTKELTRLLKNRLVYTKTEGPEKNAIYSTGKLLPAQIAQFMATPEMRAKWKVKVLLNEIPFADALAIYRKSPN